MWAPHALYIYCIYTHIKVMSSTWELHAPASSLLPAHKVHARQKLRGALRTHLLLSSLEAVDRGDVSRRAVCRERAQNQVFPFPESGQEQRPVRGPNPNQPVELQHWRLVSNSRVATGRAAASLLHRGRSHHCCCLENPNLRGLTLLVHFAHKSVL